ncbi:hypothetical protein HK097_001269 [Rhizophlyctis rosea]|uniref:Uncharacterized protein n=1 Tax=Rhizophlyctis rosea TaxID=64517 RepID=A0AAD5X1G2_9FUNG|nr:hypothetical protein HK097_001269 [Rhizophlyctis rosea]
MTADPSPPPFPQTLTRPIFLRQCLVPQKPATANPTLLPPNTFYTSMINNGLTAWEALSHFLPCSKAEQKKWPHPVWTFSRFGQSLTTLPTPLQTVHPTIGLLPASTKIFIGGEHEDSYDPDFNIYNDVIIIKPPLTDGSDSEKEIHILTYPHTAFPPTDFHTATQISEKIYIIGNIGYDAGANKSSKAQICVLDLPTLSMQRVDVVSPEPVAKKGSPKGRKAKSPVASPPLFEPVATTDEDPGWISQHNAELTAEGNILVTVQEGRYCTQQGGCEPGQWLYNPACGKWSKVPIVEP